MERKYSVILFKSVTHALSAEKILIGRGIPFKLIPVPKQISSDCGVCIRCLSVDEETITRALEGRVDIDQVVSL